MKRVLSLLLVLAMLLSCMPISAIAEAEQQAEAAEAVEELVIEEIEVAEEPEEPAEEPAQEPEEESAEEPAQEPEEEPVQETEEPAEEPTEEPAEEPTAAQDVQIVGTLAALPEGIQAKLIVEQPRNLKVEADTATSVYLSWRQISSDYDGYEIQSSVSSSFSNPVYSRTTMQPYYVYTGLPCGELRYYRVRAYIYDAETDENVYSEWSDTVSMRTLPPAPQFAAEFTAVSATSVELSWSMVDEATGYIVERDGTRIFKSSNNTTLTYKDTGLTTGQTYTYRIFSYKTVAPSSYKGTDYDEVKYKVVPPAPKEVKASSAGFNSIKITWKKVDDISGYKIYRSVYGDARFTLLTTIADPNTLSYVDTKNIALGEKYQYYVVSYCSDTISSLPSTTATGVACPTAPTGVTARYASPSSIKVSWQEVEDVSGYIIEASDTNDADSFEEIARVPAAQLSYTETGLSVGQGRYYRVRAYVGSVDGDASLVVYDATRPLTPKDLELTPIDYNKIRITWMNMEGADGYEIYRSTDGENYTLFATKVGGGVAGETNSRDNGSLTCGKTYWYKVRAYVLGGLNGNTKLYGAFCTAKSLQAQPAAPESVTAIAHGTTNAINASWPKVSGANGYNIYYKEDGGESKYAGQVGSATLTYTIKNLNPLHEYEVVVRAYRTVNGEKVLGAPKTSDKLTLPLYQPKKLTRTPVNMSSFTFSWDKAPGAQGYEIEVTCKDDSAYLVEQDQTATSITLTGMTCGYRYDCYVRAYVVIDGEKQYSGWSAMENATPSMETPADLKARTLTGSHGVQLTWTSVEGCSGYYIYRSEQETTGFARIAQLEGAAHKSYNDVMEPEQVGQTYFYRITSYVNAMGGQQESPTTAVVSCQVLPLRPTLKAVSASESTIQLSWSAVSSADGYYIYRSTSASGTYALIKTVGKSTTATINGALATGTRYYYKVCAYKNVDGKKVLGTLSAAQSAVPSPTAPQNLRGNPYARSITIAWDKVTGADGYRIFRAVGNGEFVAYKDVTTLKYTDTELVCGQTYRYKVAAYVVVNGQRVTGNHSTIIDRTTRVPQVKGTKSAVVNASSLKLTWTKIADVDGYEIQVSTTDPTGTFKKQTSVTTNAATIKGVPTGNHRYYKVRAYVDENGERFYGDWSTITHGWSAPVAPTGLACSYKTSSAISLTWKPASKAAGYKIYARKSSEPSYSLVATITGESLSKYLVTGLSSNTTYYFKIQSFCYSPEGDVMNGLTSSYIGVKTK